MLPRPYSRKCRDNRNMSNSSGPPPAAPRGAKLFARFLHLGAAIMVPVSLRRVPFMDVSRYLRSAALVALTGLSGCLGETGPPAEPAFYRSMANAEAEVDGPTAASMITGYRHNNGLGAVEVDPDLMRLALDPARGLAARDKLDRSAGRDFNKGLAGAGFNAKKAVENISAGYHTLAEAFSGWRDSPPHRANMLNKAVTRMGIAAAYAPKSKYKVFWSLILAAPDARRG